MKIFNLKKKSINLFFQYKSLENSVRKGNKSYLPCPRPSHYNSDCVNYHANDTLIESEKYSTFKKRK